MGVVSKEFKRHGAELQGPCAKLARAGNYGKFPGNVARDVQRAFAETHNDQAPGCLFNNIFASTVLGDCCFK